MQNQYKIPPLQIGAGFKGNNTEGRGSCVHEITQEPRHPVFYPPVLYLENWLITYYNFVIRNGRFLMNDAYVHPHALKHGLSESDVIYHAMSPPTKRVLIELGLFGGRE